MSRPVAILCSGQGGQHRAMFDLVAGEPAAEPVFAAARRHLGGADPRLFVRAAPEADLFSNRTGQILCCTQALAAWAALGDARPQRTVIAGYSVGELAAWGCAGCLEPAALLSLAVLRAEAMDAASPAGCGLLAVSGLRRHLLERLLDQHRIWLAIRNPGESVVLGGAEAALADASESASALGASRSVRLRVAVPSHTPLLKQASARFREALEAAAPGPPAPEHRLLGGLGGERVREVSAGCDRLARQISEPVDWAACLAACDEAGAVASLELGPGTALSRMAACVLPAAASRPLEAFRTIEGARQWLGQIRS